MMSIEPHTEGNDMKKCGDLSWLERMSKEFENDPEYLREYIELCSGEINDQKAKIAALERRCQELTAEIARLRKPAHDFLSQALNEGDGVYRP